MAKRYNPNPLRRKVSWLCLGDWGSCCTELDNLAMRMAKVAEETKPDFIMCLGDNFYPFGTESVDSDEFAMWRVKFLQKYPSLRVPWKVVLGNHDYNGNIAAELEFTTAKNELNCGGLWQMRGDVTSLIHDPEARARPPSSCCYSFAFPKASSAVSDYDRESFVPFMESNSAEGGALPPLTFIPPEDAPKASAYFVAFDSNAAQYSVRREHPNVLKQFPDQLRWLEMQKGLTKERHTAQGTWRFYFAHHPFYTNGAGHEDEARCLRSDKYPRLQQPDSICDGLNLEARLVDGGFDVCFSGHEHVLQFHEAKGMMHFVCGGTIENHYYKGRHDGPQVDFAADGKCGFLSCMIEDSEEGDKSVFRAQFIERDTGIVLKEVVKEKPA